MGPRGWLAHQRLEQRRQLILAPGALLLIGAATMVLSHAPRPFAPPLRDVSTDLLEPPRFASFNASFPAATAAVIRSRYPALAAIRVRGDPGVVEALARQSARDLGWEVTPAAAASSGTFEARVASRLLLHDICDVVIRIRPSAPPAAATVAANSSAGDQPAASSVVDVRSRSRDRTRDFGMNAANIAQLAFRLSTLDEVKRRDT